MNIIKIFIHVHLPSCITKNNVHIHEVIFEYHLKIQYREHKRKLRIVMTPPSFTVQVEILYQIKERHPKVIHDNTNNRCTCSSFFLKSYIVLVRLPIG